MLPDNFIASYFLLSLAVIMLIVGLIFKISWVFYISSVAWALSGMYYMLNAGTNEYVGALGLFLVTAGVATAVTPNMMREKPIEEAPLTYRQRLSKRVIELRERRQPGVVARNLELCERAERGAENGESD